MDLRAMITDIEMRRCLSGYESNKTLAIVGRLTWKKDGKTFGAEMETGPSEEELLITLSKCLEIMIHDTGI